MSSSVPRIVANFLEPIKYREEIGIADSCETLERDLPFDKAGEVVASKISSVNNAVMEKLYFGYDICGKVEKNFIAKNFACESAYVPMWLYEGQRDGKTYAVAVNGDSGEVAGNLVVPDEEYGVLAATNYAYDFEIKSQSCQKLRLQRPVRRKIRFHG